MTIPTVHVTRTSTVLQPNQSRVLLRPFNPGDEQRTCQIIGRIMALPEDQIAPLVQGICDKFCHRHEDIQKVCLERYGQICDILPQGQELSELRRQLIGSYFLAEYSLESAALFNPSIVRHPDQTGLSTGALRFVLSLRATGEGHVSSITFRTGIIHPDKSIEVLTPVGFLTEPRQIANPGYDKPLFERKLAELNLNSEFTRRIMGKLPDSFTLEELRATLKAEQFRLPDGMTQKDQAAAQGVWMLARSNYEVQFQPGQELSERIIFPATPSQRNGIEDARFVCFQNDDGSLDYYATFTAYDGKIVVPELVETADFLHFRFITLNGPAAINKGMALFPRKIGGRYAMLSRQDNENISIMFSDNVHFWNESTLLLKPVFHWELVQLGNCGSPIETDAGWLVLSHGVGPMREYCIGAFLLDRDDPTKVLGRLREPLLKPNAEEREGYVPNVVYTCGFLIHEGDLIIPYGLADHATSFATVPLSEVLAAMEPDLAVTT
ncbi:glycoside hydrolase family 130 protein [Paludibaculum fermentans]|uniref:Glycoside hydrolase family 130 protein n=1 Tax=Paludibaculum fermentans TaxID=1473598 RepID=A0A7S7NMN5_PALFE|nr:glycoside hydrolase family 130 protein [Paludibaculum fermentans]QOY86428.1 glycoside hydrolase family 130 protein [Paludibaculum fermentans]